MDSLSEAQRDLRAAYCHGAPGTLCSAAVWLTAGVVSIAVGSTPGILTLVFGGMLIVPASLLLSRALGGTGRHARDNPLAGLALASTVWMLLSMVVALALALTRPTWFFPAMLLVIGGRYLTFSTLYGLGIYRVLGASLAAAAFLLAAAEATPASGAFAGAGLEAGFGLALLRSGRPGAGTATSGET